MPNRNYQAGVRFERERKHHYEGEGYLVVRAAGSKGPFDLVAVRANTTPLLIQTKVCASPGIANRWVDYFVRHYTDLGRVHQRIECKVKGTREIVGWTI